MLAVMLTGCYVWFRADQARQRREAAAAEAASPSTPATTAPITLMHGSKSGTVGYNNPYPSTNAIGSGFKLNNSISAEFTVASDTKVGIVNLIPDSKSKTTQPTTAQRSNERSTQP